MAHRSGEIAKRLPTDRPVVGAEIGVNFGKNAESLLSLMPNLKLFLIDSWEKPPTGNSYYNSGEGIADRPPGYFKKCLREAKTRTGRFGNRVVIMQMTSGLAAAQFSISETRFDFVFIDADHSYEGVLCDLVWWWPLVAHGGYLCGHDYDHPRIGEVKRAVDRQFKKVELGLDMTWFVSKR